MAQTFFPEKSIKVKASKPHDDTTEYLVSIGTEIWEGNPHKVIKVQMLYDGKTSGRRSPSYPFGTDDYLRVNEAIQKLISQ